MDFIYTHLTNDTPTVKPLRKFIWCDVRNKYCAIKKTLVSWSCKLITKNQTFNERAVICQHRDGTDTEIIILLSLSLLHVHLRSDSMAA